MSKETAINTNLIERTIPRWDFLVAVEAFRLFGESSASKLGFSLQHSSPSNIGKRGFRFKNVNEGVKMLQGLVFEL